MTEEECRPLRYTYDVLGEQVLERLNEISPPPSKAHEIPRNQGPESIAKQGDSDTVRIDENVNAKDLKQFPQTTKPPSQHPFERKQDPMTDADPSEKPAPKPPTRDLYAILKEHHENDPLLTKFWNEVTEVPSWVDWDQIARGQDVFYRYGGANLTGLAYQSLLGGLGAAKVVETLARTGGFSTKVANRRLFETTQHILQVTKSLSSMQPLGDGWASTIRVRLLHAAVRNRILKLEKDRPGYYDVAAYGVPINDLDSMATISTFSATLLFMSLPRQGVFPRRQECEDYIALWRYVGHVIGCPVSPYFASPGKARAVMESLYLHEIHPSEISKILANNVIKSLANQPPAYASADFLTASARWLNGNALGDALGLPRPSAWYWALMAGQCIFFCSLIYVNRSVEAWDRKKIEMVKRIFWGIIVESKYGLQGTETQFQFHYVPEYSIMTEMGSENERKEGGYTVEGQYARTLAYTVLSLGVGAYVAFRVTAWFVSKVF